MQTLGWRFTLGALAYVLLLIFILVTGRQFSAMPAKDASALVLDRVDALLQAEGFVPTQPNKRFGLPWMKSSLAYRQPACLTTSWAFAADSSVNMPQYFTSTMGDGFNLTYAYYNMQGEPPVSLVRWIHRYILQVGARLGLTPPPISVYLMIAHPKGCSDLPDLRRVFYKAN